MNESERMKELAKIQKEFDAREHKGNANVYLAGSWFTPNSIKLLVKAYRELAKNPYAGAIYVPVMHQYKGSNPFVDGEFKPDQEWATFTFKADVNTMRRADLGVILLDIDEQGPGMVWESDYLYSNGKPTIGVTNEDTYKKPTNLMPAQSILTWTDVDELSNIDLDNIETRPYKGQLKGLRGDY